MVQWDAVELILILRCILGFQSQIIDIKNTFSQAYIPSGGQFFAELPRDFNSDGGKCNVVLRLMKILYGLSEAVCLWYKKL